jgi:hypothetical protein
MKLCCSLVLHANSMFVKMVQAIGTILDSNEVDNNRWLKDVMVTTESVLSTTFCVINSLTKSCISELLWYDIAFFAISIIISLCIS